ncbi:40s ribosomal protein s5-like, partial [Lynx pardinus]
HAFKVTEWEMVQPASQRPLTSKPLGKWSTNDVQMSAVSLKDYIAVKQNVPKYLSRSTGHYAAKCFLKAWRPAVEGLTNSMTLHGHNNGKQLMTMPVAKCTLEIIYLLT